MVMISRKSKETSEILQGWQEKCDLDLKKSKLSSDNSICGTLLITTNIYLEFSFLFKKQTKQKSGLQWGSEKGQSLNVKILKYFSTITRLKHLTWFSVKKSKNLTNLFYVKI